MANDHDKLLIAAIEQHEANAETYGNLQEDRTEALDYYLGKPLGNEVEGRSQVINRTVWDTVEWLKPQLADVFCSGEEIVSFAPRGPEDTQAAEQESEYVNYLITQRNPWFEIFYNWSHDALIQKNGYVKVYWDDAEDITSERYQDLTNDEFLLLSQDKDIEIVEHEERAVSFDPAGAFVEVLHTVKVERKKPRNVVRIENVAPEHVRVDQHARSVSLQDHRVSFCQHAEMKTISELRQEGFDVPDDINDGGDGVGDWEEDLRDDYTPFRDREGEASDPSMRRVKVRETWIRFDKDGDGKAELLHCIVVGTEVLHCEETDHIPLVSLCPTPLAHRHYGLSVADAVMDLQRIQTALLRGALDNQYLANNGRYGVNTRVVNMDDMLDSRAGGIVRVEGEVGQAFFPLTHPTNGQIAIPMMEYVEKIAQRRTGVSEMSQGLDPNALNNQAGAEANSRMMTAGMQRVKFIARVFAETGVKALFQLVHQLTLKHSRQTEMVRLRGQWVPIDPRTWVKRNDLAINLTLGTGDKPQQIMMLQQIGAMQKDAMVLGIARPKNVFNTAVRLTQLMGHRDWSQFCTDPGEEPMKPPQDPKIVVEQMRMQSDVQRFQAEAMLQREIESIRAQAKHQETQLQLELQAANDARDSDREALKAQYDRDLEALKIDQAERIKAAELAHDRWKTEFEAGVQLQQAQMSAQTTLTTATMSAEKDITLSREQAEQKAKEAKEAKKEPEKKEEKKPESSGNTESALAAAISGMTEVIKASQRPRKIIRGADGRPEGIE
jgi:hypothetical protein